LCLQRISYKAGWIFKENFCFVFYRSTNSLCRIILHITEYAIFVHQCSRDTSFISFLPAFLTQLFFYIAVYFFSSTDMFLPFVSFSRFSCASKFIHCMVTVLELCSNVSAEDDFLRNIHVLKLINGCWYENIC